MLKPERGILSQRRRLPGLRRHWLRLPWLVLAGGLYLLTLAPASSLALIDGTAFSRLRQRVSRRLEALRDRADATMALHIERSDAL